MTHIIFKVMDYLRRYYWKKRYSLLIKRFKLNVSTKAFNGEGILLYGEGSIKIGKNSYIGHYSSILAAQNMSVAIGENCAISHNVRIYTRTYLTDQDFNVNVKKQKSGSIEIGNGVWIGANCVLLPGIKIGDNAVIGANSVITENVSPLSIISGIPAKHIRFKSLVGE